jgi:ribosomal-protein-alanine N-acetyltransferase
MILREFAIDDWPAIQRIQSDPDYLKHYEWTERREADVREFVGRFVAQQAEHPRRKFQLATVLKSTGEVIGDCGIRQDDSANANIGYEFDSRHWNQGLATEAATRIIQFGFDELKVHRIHASCIAGNDASARVLKKLGMRQEAHLREKEFFKGRWHDCYIFSILEPEWRGRPAL